MLRTCSLLLSIMFSSVTSDVPVGNCVTCSSPYLKDRWSTTGLPVMPADMPFSYTCLNPVSDAYKPCSGNCLQMMFPLDGMQQVVRGCYSTFFPDATMQTKIEEVSPAANSKICFGALVSNTTVFVQKTAMVIATKGIQAISLCDDSKRDPVVKGSCNSDLTIVDDNAFLDPSCTNPPSSLTCRKCMRIGDNGKCDRGTKTTCTSGTVCMKSEGRIGDVKFEIRDCQYLSPLLGTKTMDNCYDLSQSVDFPFLYGVNIGGPLTGRTCVCKDSECNPASTLQFRVLAIVMGLTTLLPFV